jgi:tetratricopeptide (TPR) repeat protein
MATLSLDAYTREIDGMMARESYDEAIAHCLHVLRTFPKHLETYRQLGKALLEKGQHGDAADVFQRVLSADPNDFVSHIGLSIIREEDGALDQALWHMERAFELSPNNAAVQGELRRLYGRREGVEPGRVRLTRGALARQYLQGDLYGPAIAELELQLASEPDRMDLQVVLAEALWRSAARRPETVERCDLILEKLPNCVRANAIMAQLRLANEQEEEAAPYLKRWQELAPYETEGLQLVVSGGGWMPSQKAAATPLELDYLEWTPPARAESEMETPEWVRELGLALGGQTGPTQLAEPAPEPEEALPDWLRETAAPAPPAARAAPSMPELPTDAAIPDWLRAAHAEAAGPQEQAAPAAAPEEAAPDWLRELAGDSTSALGESAIDADLPDWLRDLGGPVPEAEQPAAEAGTTAPSEEMPDWLRAAGEPEAESGAQFAMAAQDMGSELAPADMEIPDWLRDMSGTPESAAAEQPAAPAVAEQPVAPQAAAAEEDMSWLRDLSAAPTTAEMPAAPAEELPDWLASVTAPAAEAPAAVPPAAETAMGEEIPDWLKDITAEPVAQPPAPPAPVMEQTPPLGDSEAAPSAEALAEAEAAGPAEGEDVMAWLERLAARQGAPLEELPSVTAAPTAPVAQPPAPAAPVMEQPPAPVMEQTPPFGDSEAAPSAEALAEAEAAGPAEGEDVMAWLERLAARQGAPLEELPSVTAAPEPVAQPPVPAAPVMEQPPAPVMEQPPSLGDSEAAPSAEAIAEAEAAGPAEGEDVMAWLERLAARQGAPLEELPSVTAAPTAPVAQPPAPAAPVIEQPPSFGDSEAAPSAEALAEAEAAGPAEGEDVMAWLERLAARQGAPLEELPSVTAAPTAPVAEVPAPVEAVVETPVAQAPAAEEDMGEMPEDPEEARLWLERLMAREGRTAPAAPVMEQPPPFGDSEAAPSAEAEAAGPAEGEDVMAWLERLAARQGAPLEELPSMTAAPAQPAPVAEVPAPAEAVVETPMAQAPAAEEEMGEMPEDPEEARLWLERLMTREGRAVPATAEPPAPSAEAEAAGPAEGEDVMAWLERLAARQGAPLEELPSMTAAPAEAAGTTAAVEPAMPAPAPEPAPAQTPMPVTEETPEWLRSALGETPAVAAPAATGVGAPEAGTAPGEEDAMVWLEQLAARQGAPLEELPSVQEGGTTAQAEMPSWLSAAMQPEGTPAAAEQPAQPAEPAAQVSVPEPAPVEPVTFLQGEAITPENELQATAVPHIPEIAEGSAEGESIMAWLEQLAARQGAPVEELPSLGGERPAVDEEPELPQWLRGELTQPAATVPASLPPAEELRTDRVEPETTWTPQVVEELQVAPEELAAPEEPPAAPGEPVRDWVREAELAPSKTEAPAVPPAALAAGETVVEQLRARVKKSPKDHDARLSLGRLLMTEDVAEAIKQYEILIRAGMHLKDIIEDLEEALKAHPDHARLRRVLGDAYNHDGQFQKALELFRTTLKDLKK